VVQQQSEDESSNNYLGIMWSSSKQKMKVQIIILDNKVQRQTEDESSKNYLGKTMSSSKQRMKVQIIILV
jgi:hypothetical protein